MAVKNTLQTQETRNKNEMTYTAGGNEIRLTPEIVKNYLVSGNKDAVSLQEVVMFMNLCKYSQLNPWAREAYIIKYGSEPATLVVGQEAYQKRAEANPAYDGMESGIVVWNGDGEVIYRNGTMKLPNETIVGGWAEVYRKDRSHSTRMEVSFEEYAGRKRDGSLNGQWSKKPATMIRKVAKVQALREAFPSAFGGMYTAEEVGMDQDAPAQFVANEEMTAPVAKIEQDETINAVAVQVENTEPETKQADVSSALFG